MSEELLVEKQGRVAVITMNRPEKLNALTLNMNDAAVAVLESVAEDAGIGAVLLTGTGRGFCAGGDVFAMNSRTEMTGAAEASLETKIDVLRKRHRFPWLLHSLNKPTIAAVNGAAAGAGLGIALSCDLRIAADTARFSTAYARVGYGGDYGTTWLLTQLVGLAKAKELFFFAEVMGAEEAEQKGLVNVVCNGESLMEKALEWATKLANGPLVSYRYMKENINLSAVCDFRTMLEREADTHNRCGETEDHREGVEAFVEKRTPVFKGR